MELLATVPVLVVAALLILQMAAIASAALRAERDVRERALAAPPTAASGRIVRATVAVPPLVPGLGAIGVGATAAAAGPE